VGAPRFGGGGGGGRGGGGGGGGGGGRGVLPPPPPPPPPGLLDPPDRRRRQCGNAACCPGRLRRQAGPPDRHPWAQRHSHHPPAAVRWGRPRRAPGLAAHAGCVGAAHTPCWGPPPPCSLASATPGRLPRTLRWPRRPGLQARTASSSWAAPTRLPGTWGKLPCSCWPARARCCCSAKSRRPSTCKWPRCACHAAQRAGHALPRSGSTPAAAAAGQPLTRACRASLPRPLAPPQPPASEPGAPAEQR